MLKMMTSLSLPLLLLFVSLLLAFPCTTTSFDIAKVLAQNPSFSTFNNYLAQTQLASQINSRQTITVLAVDNAAMSSISGKSMDTIKKVLSIHVILDYFDLSKLRNINNKSLQVTSLYQTSGQASNQEGFLNLTVAENGVISFASASQQSNGPANFVNSVASEPYNLSVIQVSSLIIPSNSPAHSNPPPSSPSPSPNSHLSNSPSPSPSSSHNDNSNSSSSPSPSSSHHENSNSPSPSPSSHQDNSNSSSSAPSPSSSHHDNSNSSSSPSPSSSHDNSNSSSPSPSSSHHSNSPAPSPNSHHSNSLSSLPSPVPVKSPVPVVSPVPVAVPVASPNEDTPVLSPPAPNAPGTAPAPIDEDAKSGAPTSTGINGAFLILITILGALHIHIMPC